LQYPPEGNDCRFRVSIPVSMNSPMANVDLTEEKLRGGARD
jgi:hypothetical protein